MTECHTSPVLGAWGQDRHNGAREALRLALAEVWSGADCLDADAVLDQLDDRGYRVVAPTLFDELRAIDRAGRLLADHPDSQWCRMYEETFDGWVELGGVPADLSTVEALAHMSLTLWRKYKALRATLEDVLAGTS